MLFAGGEGGIEAFYPKNVATALDTIINTQTARTSISIQKDFTIKYATAMKHKAWRRSIIYFTLHSDNKYVIKNGSIQPIDGKADGQGEETGRGTKKHTGDGGAKCNGGESGGAKYNRGTGHPEKKEKKERRRERTRKSF